ncbi:MAG: endonuclease domain-containing protein [Burkholderiaceae bacterium]
MARNPSPIEKSFREACAGEGIHFDSEEQAGRYRVNFFDKSMRLVIELYGHEAHKSKKARTYDAKRDRQLHRDGYTVLRLTGSEIFTSLNRCIEVVKQTLSLMKPQPQPEGAIYVDWQFFDRKAIRCLHYYQKEYPEKELELVSLSALLDFIAKYLDLRGRYDVHLFGTASSFSMSLFDLDALKLRKSHRAFFNITEHQHEFIAIALVEHLHRYGTQYDRLVLVADDNAYLPLLDRGRTVDALFRRDNESTSMGPVLAKKWQDIDYVIGSYLGLETHEL